MIGIVGKRIQLTTYRRLPCEHRGILLILIVRYGIFLLDIHLLAQMLRHWYLGADLAIFIVREIFLIYICQELFHVAVAVEIDI